MKNKTILSWVSAWTELPLSDNVTGGGVGLREIQSCFLCDTDTAAHLWVLLWCSPVLHVQIAGKMNVGDGLVAGRTSHWCSAAQIHGSWLIIHNFMMCFQTNLTNWRKSFIFVSLLIPPDMLNVNLQILCFYHPILRKGGLEENRPWSC